MIKFKSAKRHIAKTFTWRIVGTIDTMILGWIITGNPLTGVKIGGMEVMTKMVLYFLHERIWLKSNFGTERVIEQPVQTCIQFVIFLYDKSLEDQLNISLGESNEMEAYQTVRIDQIASVREVGVDGLSETRKDRCCIHTTYEASFYVKGGYDETIKRLKSAGW